MLDKESLFFRSVNYQKMLNISEKEATTLAELNIQKNDFMNKSFERRASDGKNTSFTAYLKNTQDICDKIKTETNTSRPCLFALFHVGEHINIPVDLAICGLPITLPVAGEPFELLYKNRQGYCETLQDNLEILQVENRATAAQMLKAIKQGRHICIYVDGNMGQDGVHVDRGAEQVNFFDFKIRVKQTIQKLAHKYQLEVVPLFCLVNDAGQPSIAMGDVISPDNSTIMQNLYNELQEKIRMQPENWFYVQCMHRWLVAENQYKSHVDASLSDGLNFNQSHARLYNKGDNWFIVNYMNQKAVLIDHELQEDVLDTVQSGIKANFLETVRTKSDPKSQRFINSLIKENLVIPQTAVTN